MENKIYNHKSKSIGRFIILKQHKDFAIIQRLGDFKEKYIIVNKLKLDEPIEWNYGSYYSNLQNAVNDFYNNYINEGND